MVAPQVATSIENTRDKSHHSLDILICIRRNQFPARIFEKHARGSLETSPHAFGPLGCSSMAFRGISALETLDHCRHQNPEVIHSTSSALGAARIVFTYVSDLGHKPFLNYLDNNEGYAAS